MLAMATAMPMAATATATATPPNGNGHELDNKRFRRRRRQRQRRLQAAASPKKVATHKFTLQKVASHVARLELGSNEMPSSSSSSRTLRSAIFSKKFITHKCCTWQRHQQDKGEAAEETPRTVSDSH
ncbi:hypothetical protein ACLKA7_015328 [Drosophila subpalustris]